MEAARKGQVDAVCCWKLDRFGRSTLDLLANIEALHRAGVRFIATSQGLDLKPEGDAMSRLMLTMLSGVAEFERSLIRERTRLGLRHARAKGKRLGRPPTSPIMLSSAAELVREGMPAARAARERGVSRSALGRFLLVSENAAAIADGNEPDIKGRVVAGEGVR